MRRRISLIFRWTLTVLLALALEIASVWWTFYWQRGEMFDPGQVRMTVQRGAWKLFWIKEAPVPSLVNPAFIIPRGFSVRRADDIGWGPGSGRPRPFTWTACEFELPRKSWPTGTISFPLTYPILALALPTGWLWLGALRRRKRACIGCCRACGYDLRGLERASTEDERPQRRCPECGKVAAPA